jgi:hypothetical protein
MDPKKARGVESSPRIVLERSARRRTAGWLHTGADSPGAEVPAGGARPHPNGPYSESMAYTDNVPPAKLGASRTGWLPDRKGRDEAASPHVCAGGCRMVGTGSQAWTGIPA